MNMQEQQHPQLPAQLKLELARNWEVARITKSTNGFTVFYFELKMAILFPASRLFQNITAACDFVRTNEEDFIKQAKGLSKLERPIQ